MSDKKSIIRKMGDKALINYSYHLTSLINNIHTSSFLKDAYRAEFDKVVKELKRRKISDV
jgi:hypothetical protein